MMELLLLAQLLQPVPELGRCPVGYYPQSGYCAPYSATREEAIEKVGERCPVGWYPQGSYCVRY
jgi:hypothetical protein